PHHAHIYHKRDAMSDTPSLDNIPAYLNLYGEDEPLPPHAAFGVWVHHLEVWQGLARNPIEEIVFARLWAQDWQAVEIPASDGDDDNPTHDPAARQRRLRAAYERAVTYVASR